MSGGPAEQESDRNPRCCGSGLLHRLGQRVRVEQPGERIFNVSELIGEIEGPIRRAIPVANPQGMAIGPVTFQIKAQLAAPGDSTKDPTRAWPDDRKVVTLGVLTIDRIVADSDAAQKKLLFLPGRLTEGIEPSDDPLIPARDGSYAESFERRSERESP